MLFFRHSETLKYDFGFSFVFLNVGYSTFFALADCGKSHVVKEIRHPVAYFHT